jgi:chromosome condensin MukBEF complex kleisin-like MukF subunit
MAPRNLRVSVGRDDNVLRLVRPSDQDCGAKALDLVYQAAEVFTGMEDRAREVEARAKSMCKDAAEKLKQAESMQREIITEADCKLQEASRALRQAQSRVADAEDRLTAMEFRAQAAEAEAREAKQALSLVEEAIRRRLLCADPDGQGPVV